MIFYFQTGLLRNFSTASSYDLCHNYLKCQIFNEFYILAPGTDIQSTISGDRYMSGSGTSYAAPHVTGAFGVLNQMWPYMKGDNLVKLVMIV